MTAFQHNRMPGEFQLRGEKTDQRCICFSFNRWRAKFDLNRARILAGEAVALRIGNEVNTQNCHLADRIRTEVNLLDGFSRPRHHVGL